METMKIVIFKEKNEEYAINVDHVLSIEKLEHITPVPKLPDYIKGLVKVRGNLVPVVDLHNVLYGTDEEIQEITRLIVLKTDEMELALLVGEAKELLEIERSSIKQVGLIAYEKTSYFTGVINLENRLITIIDPLQFIYSLDGIKEIQAFMKEREETANH
ncbi:chemotaxis protein CheW [Bacillus andreraoultii]|uniref:chemotaxis protein CheW n=1 Tax=Bacillus andreraoultii TaxID=1499685 RepID=UPI00053A2C78|nr:chemotaxis protein CheW [Bacillus andreraoultii]